MLSRAEKEKVVERLKADVERAEGVLFVDYTGLSVSEDVEFRKKLRAAEGEVQYRVVKNSLMRRVLKDTPMEGANDWLRGTPTGLVLGFDDPVEPAKLTFSFAEGKKNLKVKGGLVENRAINDVEAESLSKMPGRVELQAQIVQLALSPAMNLLGQVKSPAGKLVGALEAKAEES